MPEALFCVQGKPAEVEGPVLKGLKYTWKPGVLHFLGKLLLLLLQSLLCILKAFDLLQQITPPIHGR